MSEFFDFIKTPEGQGLLSAAFTGLATAQRGAPLNSIGRAGMGGLLGYSNAMNAQDTRAEQEMQRKMRQMQMDEMVRKQGEEQRIRDLAKGSMLSPEQQAIGQFGPTNEGATAIGQFKPKFDTESFVSGLQGINPIEGIKLRQLMAKESPFDKVNPKDFTPASVAKFAQSKNYTDLMPVEKPDSIPSGIKEYQFAQGQGYKGSFQQFQTELKRAGASNTSVTYGAPVAGIGPDGKPVFFQPDKSGGTPSIVPGIKPPDAVKPPTEFEGKAAFYAKNMDAAENTLSRLENEGLDMTRLWSQTETGASGSMVGNMIASPRAQQARQAQNQWAEQMLRMQTGAAATQPEIERTVKTYFPQVGDGKENVDLKRQMRLQAKTGVSEAAGRALPQNSSKVRKYNPATGRIE